MAIKAGVSGGYWCRQCDLSGDYVQWLVDIEGWDWTKIFEFLGVKGEAQTRPVLPRQRPARPVERIGRELCDLIPVEFPPAKWQEHAQKFVDECAANLLNNPHLIEWLERRGVPLRVAQAFNLGWHAGKPQKNQPPCAYRNREGWGLLKQLHPKTGRPKSIWIPRGLVIPNNRNGQLASVRVRRVNSDLGPNDKKYILVSGSNQKVCMITPSAKAYVVVEAALDGLAVFAAGVPDVGFCAMGTLTAYPDVQAAEWLGQAVDILNALDFEPQGKGEKFGNKFRSWWMKRFERCRRTPMPVGKDPGEFVEKAGLAALAAWIRSQLSPVLKVTAAAPKGNVASASKPVEKKYQVPEDIERLRLLLSTRRIELHVSMETGRVFGFDAPEELQEELAILTHKPFVQRWLKEVGESVVTGRNFMNPMGKQ